MGQVYKLDQSGIIYVWWPDGTITENFPQDLYIISEEVFYLHIKLCVHVIVLMS